MKRYCFDTSGFSTPVERMPDDLFGRLWHRVIDVIESGGVAVTAEIYAEMEHSIHSAVGACIDANKSVMLLDLGDDSWDYERYVTIVTAMQVDHHGFISEYRGGTRKSVNLNDISIIALAKTLGIPVVTEERPVSLQTTAHRKIPDVCRIERVECVGFNEFLRREGLGLP